jgi:exopolysaccharide biosynthesis polyprenyl glycosylphosphotransferase
MFTVPFVARSDERRDSPSLPIERRPASKFDEGRRRALIIGAGTVGRTLAEKLDADPRYHVVGFIDDALYASEDTSWALLGPREDASAIVRQYDIDEVFVAYAPTWQQELTEELAQGGSPVHVRVVPSFYETMLRTDRMESLGDVALLSMASGERAFDRFKRAFDVVVAALCLVVFAPLMALTALLVRLTSPGPALFQQERVGCYGKRFTLYKFRTMRTDAESKTGPVLSAGKADQRLTPIGRWLRLVRLDEMPQLINVLRGEMSLVGPRPERPVFVEQFEERNPIYARRHEVRPGITGLAQVRGGYHTDARDKLRFDLYYVTHRSFALDLKILVGTIVNILMRPNGC